MYATWKFKLKKHLCEKRGNLLKKMSKNIKISKYQLITVTCKIELELALLLIGLKKLWVH